MLEHKQVLYILLLMGAVIAIGRTLRGNERITLRLFVSRVILGCAVTLIAGAAMLYIPDASPLTILGIGAAMGILGYPVIETFLHRLLSAKSKDEDKIK